MTSSLIPELLARSPPGGKEAKSIIIYEGRGKFKTVQEKTPFFFQGSLAELHRPLKTKA